MPGDQVVHRVADRPRNQPSKRGKSPGPPKILRRPQACGGADQDAFVAGMPRVDPDHGIDVRNVRMTEPDRASELAFERGEAQRMFPLMPQDEPHARRTKAARAVVEQDGTISF